MAVKSDNQKLGDALLSFARDGQFPEDASSIPPVPTIDLAPVIEELEKAKENLAVWTGHFSKTPRKSNANRTRSTFGESSRRPKTT